MCMRSNSVIGDAAVRRVRQAMAAGLLITVVIANPAAAHAVKPGARLQNTCAAVSATAIQGKVSENMSSKMADVPRMSRTGETGELQVVDSAELTARWRVPESGIRNRTLARTPKEARIPCRRPGRHGRFEWGSPQLVEWPAKKRQ